MAKDEELKIAIKIDDELMTLVNDILRGKVLVTADKQLIYKLSYHMRPLRDRNMLTIARDNTTKESVIFLNGKLKKVDQKPQVFGGYLMELIFPSLRHKRQKTEFVLRDEQKQP